MLFNRRFGTALVVLAMALSVSTASAALVEQHPQTGVLRVDTALISNELIESYLYDISQLRIPLYSDETAALATHLRLNIDQFQRLQQHPEHNPTGRALRLERSVLANPGLAWADIDYPILGRDGFLLVDSNPHGRLIPGTDDDHDFFWDGPFNERHYFKFVNNRGRGDSLVHPVLGIQAYGDQIGPGIDSFSDAEILNARQGMVDQLRRDRPTIIGLVQLAIENLVRGRDEPLASLRQMLANDPSFTEIQRRLAPARPGPVLAPTPSTDPVTSRVPAAPSTASVNPHTATPPSTGDRSTPAQLPGGTGTSVQQAPIQSAPPAHPVVKAVSKNRKLRAKNGRIVLGLKASNTVTVKIEIVRIGKGKGKRTREVRRKLTPGTNKLSLRIHKKTRYKLVVRRDGQKPLIYRVGVK